MVLNGKFIYFLLQILRVLEGPSPTFYDPSMSLLPDELGTKLQNGLDDDEDADHLWASGGSKSSKLDCLTDEICRCIKI